MPRVAAQAVIHSHPGLLDPTMQEGFDVAEGWPSIHMIVVGQSTIPVLGTNTRGTEPPGQVGTSAFWNPNYFYPSAQSYLWVMNEAAILESLAPIDITGQGRGCLSSSSVPT